MLEQVKNNVQTELHLFFIIFMYDNKSSADGFTVCSLLIGFYDDIKILSHGQWAHKQFTIIHSLHPFKVRRLY